MGLLLWAPLMRGGQAPEFVTRWRRLLERHPDPQWVRTMADLALTFARLTKCQDVWKIGLEGLMLQRSPYMDEVRAETTQKVTLKVLEKRFPGRVTATIRERLTAQPDLATLDRLFDLALTASLEAFEQELK